MSPVRPQAAFILLLAVLVAGCGERGDARVELERLGVVIPASAGFRVERAFQPPGVENGQTLVARSGDNILRVAVIGGRDERQAADYVREQTAMLISVFDTPPPPYPEFLTRQTGCPDEYRPVERKCPMGSYFTLFAGERLGYGVCSPDLARHRAGIGFFTCAARGTTVRVEYFVPHAGEVTAVERLFDSIACK